MNFPAPPSFHDPLLYPPSSSSATPQSSASSSPAPSLSSASSAPAGLRQQFPRDHSSQQIQHIVQPPPQLFLMNGINGANMPGAMVGIPTPAGHQAELNYIYGLVDELSRQLAENKRALEEVVAGVGRVRNRVYSASLGNEELFAAAGDELNSPETNMDTLVSLLTEALEKARYSRDANAAMLTRYANVLANMLKQFHEYKAKHVADVATWHRSYRAQLAEARAENSRLREQIWEMQSHAGQANALLRDFRTKYDEDAARWEARVQDRAIKQELRFWKRMAMPHLADDDPYWSDDDDIIDSAEKTRLERKAAEQLAVQQAAAAGDMEGMGDDVSMGDGQMSQVMMGGVPMQREDSLVGIPTPPPRPSSAGTTGSSGD